MNKIEYVQLFVISNSFEFTSFWASSDNKVITDFVDFTSTFL
ncbi:hypothetical protein QVO32_09035 [Bacteroides gallinaceum]|nr:hypothetical protein [Bacteroides gallinaceum]MDN0079550.1 hypothetical protein [Bacteroides gallinaceum]